MQVNEGVGEGRNIPWDVIFQEMVLAMIREVKEDKVTILAKQTLEKRLGLGGMHELKKFLKIKDVQLN